MMAQLRLELLKEEAKQASGVDHLSKVSASTFFRKVFDIEERL